MSSTLGVIHTPREADEFFTDEGCYILETWNRADDPAVSVARARVEPGVTTRLHRLAGIAERYLILSGAGRVEVEGIPPQSVGPGDLVYIPADQAQRIANTGDGDLVFLAICTPRFVPEAYLDIETDPPT
ncbi:cupin domain-containing protein [Thiocapsa rosea]|uniref:Mannose-6-phosphate isomerase-like protein (Cupin superfamily) n=1 Tax=Thiocapsa rosea TaxID=69360 RepID=A0A495V9S2_9GAMM|nr:cupin domain-containing protein [Thiocapsa rosea]RKT46069.1 mannose-6-phosphate isomerase-like protein (cupin superfamily) [Thiocapsa rosea]